MVGQQAEQDYHLLLNLDQVSRLIMPFLRNNTAVEKNIYVERLPSDCIPKGLLLSGFEQLLREFQGTSHLLVLVCIAPFLFIPLYD